MFVPLKKDDLLQSVGFAITSAEEEYERAKNFLTMRASSILMSGDIMSAKDQKQARKNLLKLEARVKHLKRMQHMAEFVPSSEPCVISSEEFEMVEANLPAR